MAFCRGHSLATFRTTVTLPRKAPRGVSSSAMPARALSGQKAKLRFDSTHNVLDEATIAGINLSARPDNRNEQQEPRKKE